MSFCYNCTLDPHLLNSTFNMVSLTAQTSPTEKFLLLLEKTILCVKSDVEKDVWLKTGRANLQNIVDYFVKDNLPIQMVLPAFPFKSPNSHDKVLGVQPDAGEEVALKRLEDFCVGVDEFYAPGSHMLIFSDGRVFNDLLGVDDDTVHAYNEKCKEIVQRNNLTHISFDCLENHVTVKDREGEREGEKERLIDVAGREYLPADFDVENLIREREDIKNTYLGFRSFLNLDLNLRWSKPNAEGKMRSKKDVDNECKRIAKLMIVRNQAFSSLVAAKYPNHIRWSIHSGNMKGPKFSISLVNTRPNTAVCASATPWHNVLLSNNDGEVFAVRRADVNLDKYELTFKHGIPWGYKEKIPASPSSALDTPSGLLPSHGCYSQSCPDEALVDAKTREEWAPFNVQFKSLTPFGVMIEADRTQVAPPIHILPRDSIRALVLKHSTVVLRGFAKMSKDDFVEGTRRFGPLVSNPHGFITDVKEVDDPKISVFTREAMPVHFDGMFRLKKDSDEADIPFMQIFQCVIPPAPTDEGGITVFIDTRRMLNEAFTPEEVERLRKLNIGYYMPPSGMFGGKWVYFNVVVPHPITGEPIIRTHEPWSEEKSEKFSILAKAKNEEEAAEVKEFFDKISALFYDERFAYMHNWEKHDILFADNHSQLHTRTAYKTASRHLRRLHIQE